MRLILGWHVALFELRQNRQPLLPVLPVVEIIRIATVKSPSAFTPSTLTLVAVLNNNCVRKSLLERNALLLVTNARTVQTMGSSIDRAEKNIRSAQ